MDVSRIILTVLAASSLLAGVAEANSISAIDEANSVHSSRNPAAISSGRSSGETCHPGTNGCGTDRNPYSGMAVGQPLHPHDLGFDPNKPEPDNR